MAAGTARKVFPFCAARGTTMEDLFEVILEFAFEVLIEGLGEILSDVADVWERSRRRGG